MLRIGFANEFYTLWDVESLPEYFTDSYGNHHLVGEKTYYSYIQNVSTCIEKVKQKYPDLTIDETLRGRGHNFSLYKTFDDTTPQILKFGKYCGKLIDDIIETDFDYVIWLANSCYNEATRNYCLQLPKVVEHMARLEAEKKALVESYAVAKTGLVDLTFLTNANRRGDETHLVYENSKKQLPVPNTINWQPISEFSKRGDTERVYTSPKFTIYRWVNAGCFGIVQHNYQSKYYATVEEAMQACEVQLLLNSGKNDEYLADTEFTPLMKKYYAEATCGNRNKIIVFFDHVKYVDGIYPYSMPIIGGKAKRVKGKTMQLNVKIIYTDINEHRVIQVAVVNE